MKKFEFCGCSSWRLHLQGSEHAHDGSLFFSAYELVDGGFYFALFNSGSVVAITNAITELELPEYLAHCEFGFEIKTSIQGICERSS